MKIRRFGERTKMFFVTFFSYIVKSNATEKSFQNTSVQDMLHKHI